MTYSTFDKLDFKLNENSKSLLKPSKLQPKLQPEFTSIRHNFLHTSKLIKSKFDARGRDTLNSKSNLSFSTVKTHENTFTSADFSLPSQESLIRRQATEILRRETHSRFISDYAHSSTNSYKSYQSTKYPSSRASINDQYQTRSKSAVIKDAGDRKPLSSPFKEVSFYNACSINNKSVGNSSKRSMASVHFLSQSQDQFSSKLASVSKSELLHETTLNDQSLDDISLESFGEVKGSQLKQRSNSLTKRVTYGRSSSMFRSSAQLKYSNPRVIN